MKEGENIQKKKRWWLVLLGILTGSLFLFYISSLAAIFLDQTLKNPDRIQVVFGPIQVVSYCYESYQTFLFTILFFVILLMGTFVLFTSETTNTYQSDLIEITPDIKIPAPAGQGQYGTAKFLEKSKFDEVFDTVIIDKRKLLSGKQTLEVGGLVIGKEDLKNKKEKLYLITKDRHSLNIAITRGGKTRHVVMESMAALMLAGENIFAVDMKQELYDYTGEKAQDLGYRTICIDFIHPYQSDRNNYLEPIIKELKKGDISRAIEETWSLTGQLVGEPPENGEKLWNNGEASTLAASIMAVCYDNQDRPEYQNLTNVYYFITEMCQDYRGALPLQFYIDSLPEDHPSRILLAATKLAAFKTRSSFYVSAVMTLKLFTMPSINAMTNTSDFDLEKLIRTDQKTIIYLCLPARDDTYFPLASLVLRQISDLIDRMADLYGGRCPRRWNFYEDEFGNFTKITNITQQLSFGTGKGILHNLFVQSYAQIDEKYGKETAQIIKDNCDTTIYLRSPNYDTREAISKDLDDYTTHSYSISNNMQSGTMTGQGSRGESVNLAGRRLLFPREIYKIRRPYSLVMTEHDPAITYAPDFSQYAFNEFFGLGDEHFNQKLRIEKQAERKKKERSHDGKIALWGIWNVWKKQIDIMIEEQERRKRAMAQEKE